MKFLLLITLGALAAVEDPFAQGDRIGLVTRDDVMMEVWRPRGSAKARVVLTNRTELRVRVTYAIGASSFDLVEYDEEIDGKASVPFADATQVDVGNTVAPEVRLVRVAKLPISEASGYVRIAEDRENGVGIMLFRAVTGGNQAYAVIANTTQNPLTVEWLASGLSETSPLAVTTLLPAQTTLGLNGSISMVYHPVADPRQFEQVRVEITAITKRQ